MSDETQRSRMVQASQVLEAVRSFGRAAIEYQRQASGGRGQDSQEYQACHQAMGAIESLAVRLVQQGSTMPAVEVEEDTAVVY